MSFPPAERVAGGEFERRFDRTPGVVATAPGRVNLIGEHTDYNEGYVLPVALPQHCRAEVAARDDLLVRAASADLGATGEYRIGAETRGLGWVDFVQGIGVALRDHGFTIRGFDLFVRSEVPIGAGLASSAALEISVLRALRRAFDLPLDDVALARLGQEAENAFVGARVGIMDQMAASLGGPRHALFLDARSLEHERIPLPPGMELIVIDSGVPHEHAKGEYNRRREECERACEMLGVRSLRDVGPADLPRVDGLPDPFGRRVRHVVTENARVLQAVEALREDDFGALGALLVASHVSLRDLYEVSIPELDRLVELATGTPGVAGARLTGGGFGGSIVAVARMGRGREAAERIAEGYAGSTGRTPTVRLPG